MANFKVVTGALNVRVGPSIKERSINTINEGDIVAQCAPTIFTAPAVGIVSEVSTRHPTVRTWLKIEDGANEGWTSLKFLDDQPNGSFKVNNTSGPGTSVRSEPFIPQAPHPDNSVGTLTNGISLPVGDMVAEIEINSPETRKWVRLDLGAAPSGWASMRLLEPTASATNVTPAKYEVTADNLHVRARPTLESDILGDVSKGTQLLDGAITNDGDRRWMKISAPVSGFVAMKFLSRVSAVPVPAGTPKWYAIARGQQGIKEFTGPRDNPEVVKYLESCSTLSRSLQRDDETAWCSAFVNWCVEQAGFEGTESASARSWMHWGHSIAAPTLGCIVVLNRGSNPAFGHVGFFVKAAGGLVYLLGGNQSDTVNVTAFSQSRVLSNGFRMR